MRAKITGTGMAVPKRIVTNDDLSKQMDTSDEWIRQRSGIEQRHWVSEGETPSTLAHEATLAALEQAGLEPGDLDCILLATLSAEHDFPGTSFFLHERLDLDDTPCIDLRAQCSGFLYALSFADSLILSGKYERVLVVGAEVHSTGLDVSTRGRDVAVLFGDGAGAVVLEPNRDENDPAGVLHASLHAEGRHARRLWLEYPSSAHSPMRLPQEAIDEGRIFPKMEGRFVFKHAVTRMPEVLREALDAASVKLEDVDLFLFHQANLRINEYVAGQLEIPAEKIFNNIQRYGNCSAGSIPMLLAECSRNGLLAPGRLVCMTGFGSGFTWASAVVRW
jgi:3-oxoacyl-[acyl-carrier-protein] synthase-3